MSSLAPLSRGAAALLARLGSRGWGMRSNTAAPFSTAAGSAPPALDIHEDIHQARTPPGSFYRTDAVTFAAQRQRIFGPSWQIAPALAAARKHGDLVPFTLLRGALDEPLLGVRDGEQTRCISNVCTHRGMLLCPDSGAAANAPLAPPQTAVRDTIRCGYHGRRFALDGRCKGAPGFDSLLPTDDLAAAAVAGWGAGALPFVSLQRPGDRVAGLSFTEAFGDLAQRLSMLPMDKLVLDPSGTKSFHIKCHWMLYCENYLEGLHVPFVHKSLQAALSLPPPPGKDSDYRTELFGHASLQIGQARPEEPASALLPSGADARFSKDRVVAYYAFLFPNTMLNFYTWGCSVNVVVPEAPDRTRVDYFVYRWPAPAPAPSAATSQSASGAGDDLHTVEAEDDAIVEAVQRGIGARLYDRGRYSPRWETGTHQFHRLVQAALK